MKYRHKKTKLVLKLLMVHYYTVCDRLWPSYNRAANTGVHANMGMRFTWPKPEYSLPKPYFNVHALIFYVCEVSSQVILGARSFIDIENMQKNYGINVFDYEGHDL